MKCQDELKNLRQNDEETMQEAMQEATLEAWWNVEISLCIAKISQGLQKFRNHSENLAILAKFSLCENFAKLAKFS